MRSGSLEEYTRLIQLLYGPDSFSLREALSKLKTSVSHLDLGDVNITVLDGKELRLNQLIANCNALPFLAQMRLVIVENLLSQFENNTAAYSLQRPLKTSSSSSLKEWDTLPEHLVNFPETTHLVFVDGPLRGKNRLLAKIGPLAQIRTFPTPSRRDLQNWIKRRVTKKGSNIDTEAVMMLADIVGHDLQTLDSEIEKLTTYRPDQIIREEDIVALVSYAKDANIFATVDAMINGSSGQAITQAHQVLNSGRPTTYILSMIARQVRMLILVKDLKSRKISDSKIGSRLGLSGYPLQKTIHQEKQFTLKDLKYIHTKLVESDIKVKTSGSDEHLVLDLLIAEISNHQFTSNGIQHQS